MEVTKRNFETIFPEIIEDIESAAFVSIDGEFTGLNNGLHVDHFETPEDTYLKLRSGSMDFLLIQFGLSIFIKDEITGKYKNKSYVFYLFPFCKNSLTPDPRFVCQSSSINFLISNNFDFNKLFREGITYMNATQEINIARDIENKRKNHVDILRTCPDFGQDLSQDCELAAEEALEKLERIVQLKVNEVIIEGLDERTKNYVWDTFMNKYGDLIDDISITHRNKNPMICTRGRDSKRLDSLVGFSRVIRKISSKGCLVVGHNMLLDVCHTVNRFMGPLPPDYETFKEMVHDLFPRLVDTKLIASESYFKGLIGSSVLTQISNKLAQSPFVQPNIEEVDGYSYAEGGQLHDAGYDAFLTGKVFLTLMGAMTQHNETIDLVNCRALEKYINKLYLMKSPDTCIDLVNPDPVPARDNLFHVTFSKRVGGTYLNKALNRFGRIQVYYLSDTSAWILVEDRSKIQSLMNAKLSFPVTPYDRYWTDLLVKKRPCEQDSVSSKKIKTEEGCLTDVRVRKFPSKQDSAWSKKIKTEEGASTSGHRESKKAVKESAIKRLEDAASSGGGEFEQNTSWD